MIKKIEHIGIAVEDLGKSEALFEKLLGVKPYKKENVQTEGVTTSFFIIADQKIELLHAITDNSPIKKFIDKRNEGVHHIALHVDSIKNWVVSLKKFLKIIFFIEIFLNNHIHVLLEI